MKYLGLFIGFSLAFSTFAQVNPQIEIPTIREVRNEASAIISGFKIPAESIGIGAPDYKFARLKLLEVIKNKPTTLANSLANLNNKLKDDYALIKSLRSLVQDEATKKTVKVAVDRYKSKVKNLENEYQSAIKEVINGNLVEVSDICMTVLCLKKISQDISNWQAKASKLNKKIDFEEEKMNKVKPNDLKEEADYIRKAISDKEKGFVIALNQESKECINLSNPELGLDQILKFGTELIATNGLDGINKIMDPTNLKIQVYNGLKSDNSLKGIVTIKNNKASFTDWGSPGNVYASNIPVTMNSNGDLLIQTNACLVILERIYYGKYKYHFCQINPDKTDEAFAK